MHDMTVTIQLFPTNTSEQKACCGYCGNHLHEFQSQKSPYSTLYCCPHCLLKQRASGLVNFT